MAQNLGNMGERFFNYLCATEDINCNASDEDMVGWDYILDFPFESNGKGSDDAMPPIECKIQVKATTKKRKYWDIKLSNLLRFCKSPLPSFILFMEFDGSKSPQRLYLVHFGKDLIKESLIAIRKAEQSNGKHKLNSSSKRVTYNESHKLEAIDGATLKRAIESYIPSGLGEYSIEKINYASEVGYETGVGFVKFRTENDDSLLKMIEASIGLEREIEVKDIIISESRFGIDLASPLHEAQIGTLKIMPVANSFDIIVRFKEDRFSSPIEFNAKAFYPPIQDIPQELLRIRVKTAFFDLVLGLGERASTYHLTMDDEKHSLKDLEDQAKLLNWICYDKKKLFVDFILKDNPEIKTSLIITPTIDEEHLGGSEWKEELLNIERAMWIASKFKVESILRLTINELYSKRENILRFYNLYNYFEEDILFNFRSEGDYDDENLKLTHSTTYGFHLKLAGALMVSIVTFQGKANKIKNNEYNLSIDTIIHEKEAVTFEKDSEFIKYLQAEMSSMNKRYSEQGMMVINAKQS